MPGKKTIISEGQPTNRAERRRRKREGNPKEQRPLRNGRPREQPTLRRPFNGSSRHRG